MRSSCTSKVHWTRVTGMRTSRVFFWQVACTKCLCQDWGMDQWNRPLVLVDGILSVLPPPSPLSAIFNLNRYEQNNIDDELKILPCLWVHRACRSICHWRKRHESRRRPAWSCRWNCTAWKSFWASRRRSLCTGHCHRMSHCSPVFASLHKAPPDPQQNYSNSYIQKNICNWLTSLVVTMRWRFSFSFISFLPFSKLRTIWMDLPEPVVFSFQ